MATAGEIGKQLVARMAELAERISQQLIDFGIDGNDTFPGARATESTKLQERGDREPAIDALVTSHIGLASAQGFATSVGGLITLPIGLPANLAGMAVLSVRMVAGVAHLRGYDVTDRRVRAAVALAMLGEEEIRRLMAEGKLPTTPLAVATAPVFDPELERTISRRVAGWLSGRLGGKHLAVVVLRRIPLVGGGVGAAVDGFLTYTLAAYARREFVARQQLTRFSE